MSAQKDIDFHLSRKSSVFIHLGNEVSVWEKNLQGVLARELEATGFRSVGSFKQADLVLTYHLGERTTTTSGYDTVPVTSTTFGYIGRRQFVATSTGFRTVPYTYTQDEKGLLIKVFAAKEFAEGKRVPVWEGFVVGDRDLFNSRQAEWARALVRQIGQDYDGRVTLD